jgi:beta-lactamase regulating signal transducer with metallopeptidase domain
MKKKERWTIVSEKKRKKTDERRKILVCVTRVE